VTPTDEIENKFRAIFIRDVGAVPEDISTPRQDIPAWDSLRHAQLIISIQKQFGFRFAMTEILQCESYENLRNLVLAKAQAG
jgi:acyl carrier protein